MTDVSAWLVLAIVACAAGAICARRLVSGALWLMATSILVSVLLATLAAPIVAVVELSVGAGLVAVLFVFAIGIAGEEGLRARPIVPKRLVVALAGATMVLLLWLILPTSPMSTPVAPTPTTAPTLTDLLWSERGADLLTQAALIVVAALAIRAILGNDRTAVPPRRPQAPQPGADVAIDPMPVPEDGFVPAARAAPSGAGAPLDRGAAREETSV